jgi:hypothetical protein
MSSYPSDRRDVRDALHRVDADAVRGSDHAHAWAILPAQRGVDRSVDVGASGKKAPPRDP